VSEDRPSHRRHAAQSSIWLREVPLRLGLCTPVVDIARYLPSDPDASGPATPERSRVPAMHDGDRRRPSGHGGVAYCHTLVLAASRAGGEREPSNVHVRPPPWRSIQTMVSPTTTPGRPHRAFRRRRCSASVDVRPGGVSVAYAVQLYAQWGRL